MKHRTPHQEDVAEFEAPRVYTETELQGFHQKVQKFWQDPRMLENNQIAQKFDHQALAVAYGAARKIRHGLVDHYIYEPTRNRALENLWFQYQTWRGTRDAKIGYAQQQTDKEYEKLGIPATKPIAINRTPLKPGYQLSRKALNEYEQKFGKPFDVPASAEILEDEPASGG